MNKNKIRRWLVTGSALALLVTGAITHVQAGPGGPRGPHSPGGGTNAVISLTAAQQQALKDAHAAIMTQSETLLTQRETAETALQNAVLADSPTEDAIRAAAKVVGDINGSLAVIRAKELAKIRTLFTADQWTQLKTSGLFHRDLFGGPH
jgi:Spy/CpxP family protein refolding chaperone